MVCPQHTKKLFSLFTFDFVQSSPEILDNGWICHFHFFIHLRIANECEPMSNVQVGTELFEGLVVKLLVIIDDNGM